MRRLSGKSALVWRPGAWLLAMALAIALLLAQTLGLMHGLTHGQTHGVVKYAEKHAHHGAAHLDFHDHQEQSVQGNWLESLFSSHDGEPDCRLYDQASHASAAPAVAPVSLPAVLPSPVVAIFQGEALARWAALFDARGPPPAL